MFPDVPSPRRVVRSAECVDAGCARIDTSSSFSGGRDASNSVRLTHCKLLTPSSRCSLMFACCTVLVDVFHQLTQPGLSVRSAPFIVTQPLFDICVAALVNTAAHCQRPDPASAVCVTVRCRALVISTPPRLGSCKTTIN